MKFKVLSQEELLLNYLVQQIDSSENFAKDSYSLNIDFGLSELTRLYMRKIAQETEYIYEREWDLLSQAIKTTETRIKEKMRNDMTPFKFEKYFKNIRDKLKYVAQEIKELQANLLRSKREERVGQRRKLNEVSRIPIEITELGLSGFTNGLLAQPIFFIFQEYEMNLQNTNFIVEGDWFPFEVKIEDFIFTIDDDGTIFVSVENLPKRLVEQAKDMLQILANQLYTQKN
jgi:hypothetical protein